ncbi:MAG: hypothetical protein ACK44E_12680, partial [Anaerolineales bacterium]
MQDVAQFAAQVALSRQALAEGFEEVVGQGGEEVEEEIGEHGSVLVGQLLSSCPTMFLERLLNALAVAGLARPQTRCL